MTILAKRLPVVHIPKQPLIAAVWKHMIHHSRGRQFSFCLTRNAQRMLSQVCFSRFAPLSVVTPEGRAATQPVAALCNVFLAVNLPWFAEPWTAGIATGTFRFHGHCLISFLNIGVLADVGLSYLY